MEMFLNKYERFFLKSPQALRLPAWTGWRKNSRRMFCGLKLTRLDTSSPALVSSTAWSWWMLGRTTAAPTPASPATALASPSSPPAWTWTKVWLFSQQDSRASFHQSKLMSNDVQLKRDRFNWTCHVCGYEVSWRVCFHVLFIHRICGITISPPEEEGKGERRIYSIYFPSTSTS